MGDQDSVEEFERRLRDPHMEWSEATSWVAMDAMLLSVAEEQTRHHDAMMADPAVGETERSWRAVGYAGAAILLAFAAMEGHLNFQCRRWLADTLAGTASQQPADHCEVDYLVELLWEIGRGKKHRGTPRRNIGRLEMLDFERKWELLYRVGPPGEALNPAEPPLRPLLARLTEVKEKRNSFLAHPKLKPVTVRAAKGRGTGSRIVWGPPDPRLFAETREITIDAARDAIQAVKETIKLVCEATGDQLPWDHDAEAGGFLRRTVSDL
jgi:hypothetical protein